MVKIEKMTTYVCDGCGERFHDENGCVGYIDYDIWNEAESSEWQEIDGKHYCPNCCEYDEETDAYVPKKTDSHD